MELDKEELAPMPQEVVERVASANVVSWFDHVQTHAGTISVGLLVRRHAVPSNGATLGMTGRTGRRERNKKKKKKTKKKKTKTKTTRKKNEKEKGCLSNEVCGTLFTHPLKYGDRERDPWSGNPSDARRVSVGAVVASPSPPLFFCKVLLAPRSSW